MTSGEKVVLVSHSMGSQVLFYFFHWVEAPGNGGPGWVEKYVDSWVNVSGSMLGALKGLPAVLSGEMKDTAQLNAFAVYGLEKFLGKDERCEIFRTMPGVRDFSELSSLRDMSQSILPERHVLRFKISPYGWTSNADFIIL